MGGVSYWLYDSSYNGETVFVQSGEKIGKKELLDDEGLVSFDFNLTGVRTAIKNHPDYISKNPVTDFSNRVLKMFLAEVGSASTEIMIKVTSPTIQKEDDIALHIPNHPVRYAPKRWFDKRSGVLAVPEGEYALSFSQTSHDTNPDSLNDRTGFLTEYSTSKTSMAVILDTVEKVINLYKYSRTRLFKLMEVLARVNELAESLYSGNVIMIPLFALAISIVGAVVYANSVNNVKRTVVGIGFLVVGGVLMVGNSFALSNKSKELTSLLDTAYQEVESSLEENYSFTKSSINAFGDEERGQWLKDAKDDESYPNSPITLWLSDGSVENFNVNISGEGVTLEPLPSSGTMEILNQIKK